MVLTVGVSILDGRKWATAYGKVEMETSINSPVHKARLIMSSESETSVHFKFEVLLVAILSGVLPNDQNCFNEFVQLLCPGSGYFICQGTPYSMIDSMVFQTKSLRQWEFPLQRLDHKDCVLWLKSISTTKQSLMQRCKACTNLMYYIKREGKKR